MEIKWTLTSDMPVVCLGVFSTKEAAQQFKKEQGLENDWSPTMLILD